MTPEPSESARSRVRVLLGLALACVAVFVFVYVLAEHTTVGQELDEAALKGRGLEDADVRNATEELLLTISSASLGLLGVGIVAVALARRRLHLAIAVALLILCANVTTQILKVVLPRPDLLGPDGVAYGQSLPSGHATAAMSLAVAFALVLPARYRAVGALPVLLWALFIGAGTVASGWHRPSDVIAAYAVVVGWAALVSAVLVQVYDRPGSITPRSAADIRFRAATPLMLGAGATVLLVAFLGTAIGVFTIHQDGLDAIDTGTEFVLGMVAIVGSGLLLAGALLLALRGVRIDQPTGDRAA